MKLDKRQHLVMGVIVAIVVGFITYLVSGEVAVERNVAAGVYSALAGGFVAACVKEWCDTDYIFDPTAWDWWDIAATMLGAAVVALGILLMHYAKG